jgi:hypothetical protein
MKTPIRLDILVAMALAVAAFLAGHMLATLGAVFGIFCLTKARWDDRLEKACVLGGPSLNAQVGIFALFALGGLLVGSSLWLAYEVFRGGGAQAVYGSGMLLLIAGFLVWTIGACITGMARKAWRLDCPAP